MVVFARAPTQTCCSGANDCVMADICVSSGNTNWDVDVGGDNDYCYQEEWWDCKDDNQCPGNQWCDTGAKDCEDDFGLCSASTCTRNNQCESGTSCISGKCRIAATEDCNSPQDDDCDGDINYEDSDCCGGSGDSCGGGGDCCSGNYCTSASKCCPTGSRWVSGVGCRPSTECYNSPCGFAPFSSGWWNNANCVWSTGACCDVGPLYGLNPYYDDDNIVTY